MSLIEEPSEFAPTLSRQFQEEPEKVPEPLDRGRERVLDALAGIVRTAVTSVSFITPRHVADLEEAAKLTPDELARVSEILGRPIDDI